MPDQIVGIPGITPEFVEVKTTDGKLSPGQEREHKRLFETMGLNVKTVYGHAGVDALISTLKGRLSNAAP